MGLVGGSGEGLGHRPPRRPLRAGPADHLRLGDPPARENTPAPAISPVWDFAPLPTIFGVSPRRPLAGPLRPARSPEARLRLGSVLGNAWLRKVGASIVLRDCVGEGAEGRMMLAGSIVSIVAKMHGEA